jgi:hypothetical protein
MWGRHWGGLSPSTSVSPANHSTNFSIITRGWHNRPLVAAVPSGPNWTPPPTIPSKKAENINNDRGSRDNSADIAARLRTGRPTIRGSIPGRGKRFLLHYVQTCSGTHPASYTMGTDSHFLGVKRQGREADHSHPSSTKIKNCGDISPLSHTSSQRGA